MSRTASEKWSSRLLLIAISAATMLVTLLLFGERLLNFGRSLVTPESPIGNVQELSLEELPVIQDTKQIFITGAQVISNYTLKLIKFERVTIDSQRGTDTTATVEKRIVPKPHWQWNAAEQEQKLRNKLGPKKLEHMYAYLIYVQRYKALAQAEMKRTGIPASITIAQGLLEGNAGRSFLAANHNNHFGIKCKGENGQRPQSPYAFRCVNRCDDSCDDYFNSYDSAELSYQHHSWLLLQGRYRRIFSYEIGKTYSDDGEQKPYFELIAKALKKAGYATSKTYAEKLTYIIETYELYLLDYELLERVNV